jgi:2-polyprenyl-3-methyl-5-hydroxy-6-metoxy-1,4-benzoquinol methylase
MRRVPEREVMDTPKNVIAYEKADAVFESYYREYADGILSRYNDCCTEIIDLGCGTARIPILLAQRLPNANITALDASLPMINAAKELARKAGVLDRIDFVQAYLPDIKGLEGKYSLILSDGTLHHLPKQDSFWVPVKKLARIPTAVYVKDLFRAPNKEAARAIVERVSPDEDRAFKTDFYNSLLAAYSIDEVRKQLAKHSLPLKVSQVSERHMVIEGILR